MNNRFIKAIKSSDSIFIILLIMAMLIWGGSWTSGKIVAKSVHPFVLGFVRFFITFLSFIPALIIFKEKLSVDKRTFILITASSLLLILYITLFFLGLQLGMAGAGGVLANCIIPIFTFLLSLIFLKKKIVLKEIIGLILGFSAGLILLEIWNTGYAKLFNSGNIFFIIASFIWALITIISGEVQKKLSIFVFSFYMYGIATVIWFFLALPFEPQKVFNMDSVFWINILYLSVISTFGANSIYFFSSKKISASKTSSFLLLVPLFAVIISFFVLGEIPKTYTIAGGVLTMISIYLINKKSNGKIIE
jgi:drug/metabolite transporter (DMT)-like permease